MSTYEIIRDAQGKELASVCLKEPITDDERAALVEYFTLLRDRRRSQATPEGPRNDH